MCQTVCSYGFGRLPGYDFGGTLETSVLVSDEPHGGTSALANGLAELPSTNKTLPF